MPQRGPISGGPVYSDGPADRRGSPRLSITESIKLEVIASALASRATFGNTVAIAKPTFARSIVDASLGVEHKRRAELCDA